MDENPQWEISKKEESEREYRNWEHWPQDHESEEAVILLANDYSDF